MKKLLLFILGTLACHEGFSQWNYKGLGHVATNQLTIHQDSIYASTSSGLYRKNLFDSDTTWELVSFGGSKVLNTLFLDQNECLLLVETDPFAGRISLFRSSDRGKTANLFLNDTVDYKYPGLQHIAKAGAGKDTIFLLDHNKKTYNGGQTWLPLGHSPQNDNFVYVNPTNQSEVFVGGENMMFAATLQRSTDKAQNWQFENTANVFAGDNAFHVLHIIDGDWYAAGEGIFVKRPVNDSNWTQLLNLFNDQDWGQYFFGFDYSSANNDYLYLSGDGGNNSKLRLHKSSDRGNTWDTLSYARPDQTQYGVFDLKVQHVWGEDRVWLGGQGVYTYTQSVPLAMDGIGKQPMKVEVYPNPAKEYLRVKLGFLDTEQEVDLKIYNAMGQVVGHKKLQSRAEDIVNIASLPAGIYFLRVHTYERGEVLRFIKE